MQVGDQLGDYRLVREVGHGTFGVVYQAEQVYLGTQAAIKVLLDAAPEEREALLAEARKIAAWRHPHITLVLGFSQLQGFPS
jgi:serine/threonine protein kinase